MQQETEAPIRFAGFTLDLARGRLIGSKGDVPLRPKSFAFLSYMAQNVGRVVSKDELLSAVWPEVIVTEDSLTQCAHDVRRALGPAGSTLLRTVPRRGYLFDFGQDGLDQSVPVKAKRSQDRIERRSGQVGIAAPVRVAPPTGAVASPIETLDAVGQGSALNDDRDGSSETAGRRRPWPTHGPTVQDAGHAKPSMSRRRAIAFGASAMLLIGVGSVGARVASPWPLRSAAGSSIYGDGVILAVPPFQTEGSDRLFARSAESLSLQVAGALAGTRLITVVDFDVTSAELVSGTNPFRRDASLGSHFILNGVLSPTSDGVRAGVWLVDAASNARLWSASYDNAAADTGWGQYEVSDRIAAATFDEVRDAAREAAARKPEADLKPFELVLLANERRWEWSPEGNAAGVDMMLRALSIEPRSAMAWAELARLYGQRVWSGFDPSGQGTTQRWQEAAMNAVNADGNYPFARAALADYLIYDQSWDPALAEIDRALVLAPWMPEILALAGELVLPWVGQSRRAAELVDRAKRLDPVSIFKDAEAVAYFFARRFRESAAAVEWMPEPGRWMPLFATLSYAQLEDSDGVERWRQTLHQSWPDYSPRLVEEVSFGPFAESERALWRDSHLMAGFTS